MGVPKFYRWVSERYPCLSEVVKEFQLPEFDNLYLDMNGIVHVCSHPDDENPHFRITEEKIFKDICHYIDFLFRMIKPRRVFYMAVDGVAPRAKMNQQRGRRFRSAREAEMQIKKAEEQGEVLPTEKRFDSNCITPGTPFMVRLQEHLKYFVVDKITNDPLWQGPKVYLSGHETPGEGEHKVMDFIRYSKSQADYDPDTRHCLYGLDADLIMLGLTSHEPHFSLLREEVRFGGKRDKNRRPVTPEETTFHLLHLSLMRDYLAYEFSDLQGKLSFPWDLEKIIDDWILMGFLVGNDFIPHLPHLHIHHDALPLLWKTYKDVLPTLDGYLNENGHLNLPRFEKYFEELSKFDLETFESAFSDLRFLESKLGGKSINESIGQGKFKKLEKFKVERNGNPFCALEGHSANNDIDFEESDVDSDVIDECDDEEDEDDYNTSGDEFNLHKRDYYMNKMAYPEVTPEVLESQAHGYVIAIQWILLYYFDGCPSWSWFYPHHYAPYISDVRGFREMKITFDLSKPFLPFQQLMAVLPAASKELLPPAYQPLMTDPGSPIVDFYPVDFETDLNGKQQDWEAVVLIPFIAEGRLLEAMASKDHLLTREEKSRNHHGPHFMYQYSPEDMGHYPSSLPGVFPDLHFSNAKITQLDKDLFRIDANKLRKGLLDTVRLNVYFRGFPTLRFLPHTHELVKAGVKVFQHNSRGENMTLRVQSKEGQILEQVADKLLGKVTYVGWPHLHEAKVIAVANESCRIELVEEDGNRSKKENAAFSFNRRKLDQTEMSIVALEARDIKERLMGRFAIDVGQTEIIVYACPMTGRTYTYGAHGTITLEKQFASDKTPFLHQMTVQDLQVEESSHTTFKTLEEVFPVGSSVFMVGNPHYGAQGKVMDVMPDVVRVRITLDVTEEPDFRNMARSGMKGRYLNNYQAAQQIGIDSHTFARITGSVFVEKSGPNGGKVNIGLNLKFTKRGEEVPGYTKKTENGWSYSYKCVKAVEDYTNKFSDLWLMAQQNSSTDFFTEDALFTEGCITKLSDVATYLEELPCSKVPKMKFGSEILDEEQVEQIERMTASLNPKPVMVVIKVKPRLLFRPLANQGCLVPDPGTDFYLYDRVVVVKSGYSVPFGRRGTIIGIPNDEDGGITPNSLYDVVFDEAFAGGITLRCSPGKGYRVPGSAMLNLTYGEFRKVQPNVDAKAGGRPQQSSFVGYNANGGGHFGGSYNNSNNTGRQPNYADRAGSYNQIDRAALWKQQQQQPGFQQFQQQPVKWDKGQPLFGQVFAGQNQYVQGVGRGGGPPQPKFLTPKVQGSPTVIANRGLNQQWKITEENKEDENSEFNSMWKNLQTHQNTKQSVKGSDQYPQQRSVQQNQSLSPNRSLDQGPQTSAISQYGLQQQLKILQSAHTQPPSLLMSTSQQGQPFSGQLQPQLGGLLPKQSGQMSSQPKPAGSHSDVPKGGSTQSTAALMQSLFQGSSQSHSVPPGTENAEFLSVFNSLKIQNEELRRGNGENLVERIAQISSVPTSAESVKSQADIALKQLLKIGVETSASPSSATSIPLGVVHLSHIEDSHVQADLETTPHTGKSPAPLYGRHLSLQELFDEAHRQQQQQGEVKLEQHHQQQIMQSRVGMSDVRSNESRDPIVDLEVYCKNTLNTGPPMYDYKSQPKQNGYIANVILPNGQRYEGSVCRTKEEASKSAASIAILCLNARPPTSHPVITAYPPGAQRSNVNRFFSANSAFSPIGIPGPNPSVLPQRPPVSAPLLLTNQLFINQPPPTLPLHHLLQQQMQQMLQQRQHLAQQNTGQHVQNYEFELHQRQQMQTESQIQTPHTFQGGPINLLAATTTSSQMFGQGTPPATSSSVIQQFIPLQVSRNQKTPNRRKDSESDSTLSSSSDIKTHNSDEIGTQIHATSTTKSAVLTQKFDHSVVPKENRDKNGVLFQVAPSLSMASTASAAGTPTAKSNHRRKKSRLAANFGSKFS